MPMFSKRAALLASSAVLAVVRAESPVVVAQAGC